MSNPLGSFSTESPNNFKENFVEWEKKDRIEENQGSDFKITQWVKINNISYKITFALTKKSPDDKIDEDSYERKINQILNAIILAQAPKKLSQDENGKLTYITNKDGIISPPKELSPKRIKKKIANLESSERDRTGKHRHFKGLKKAEGDYIRLRAVGRNLESTKPNRLGDSAQSDGEEGWGNGSEDSYDSRVSDQFMQSVGGGAISPRNNVDDNEEVDDEDLGENEFDDESEIDSDDEYPDDFDTSDKDQLQSSAKSPRQDREAEIQTDGPGGGRSRNPEDNDNVRTGSSTSFLPGTPHDPQRTNSSKNFNPDHPFGSKDSVDPRRPRQTTSIQTSLTGSQESDDHNIGGKQPPGSPPAYPPFRAPSVLPPLRVPQRSSTTDLPKAGDRGRSLESSGFIRRNSGLSDSAETVVDPSRRQSNESPIPLSSRKDPRSSTPSYPHPAFEELNEAVEKRRIGQKTRTSFGDKDKTQADLRATRDPVKPLQHKKTHGNKTRYQKPRPIVRANSKDGNDGGIGSPPPVRPSRGTLTESQSPVPSRTQSPAASRPQSATSSSGKESSPAPIVRADSTNLADSGIGLPPFGRSSRKLAESQTSVPSRPQSATSSLGSSIDLGESPPNSPRPAVLKGRLFEGFDKPRGGGAQQSSTEDDVTSFTPQHDPLPLKPTPRDRTNVKPETPSLPGAPKPKSPRSSSESPGVSSYIKPPRSRDRGSPIVTSTERANLLNSIPDPGKNQPVEEPRKFIPEDERTKIGGPAAISKRPPTRERIVEKQASGPHITRQQSQPKIPTSPRKEEPKAEMPRADSPRPKTPVEDEERPITPPGKAPVPFDKKPTSLKRQKSAEISGLEVTRASFTHRTSNYNNPQLGPKGRNQLRDARLTEQQAKNKAKSDALDARRIARGAQTPKAQKPVNKTTTTKKQEDKGDKFREFQEYKARANRFAPPTAQDIIEKEKARAQRILDKSKKKTN